MDPAYIPSPGDLTWVSFSPQSGHEQAGRRPGLVISKRAFSRGTGFVWVCPITNQKKGYPFEVELPTGLLTSGVVLVDQARSLDYRARQLVLIESVPSDVLARVVQLAHTILTT